MCVTLERRLNSFAYILQLYLKNVEEEGAFKGKVKGTFLSFFIFFAFFIFFGGEIKRVRNFLFLAALYKQNTRRHLIKDILLNLKKRRPFVKPDLDIILTSAATE